MASIHSRDTGVAVTSCIGMKNHYIKKRHFAGDPESTSMYISSGIILAVSGGWNDVLTCKWLQWRLNNNIMAYTIKLLCCIVPNLIMTYKCKSPMVTNHSMVGGRGFTVHIMIRDVWAKSSHIEDVLHPRSRIHVYSDGDPDHQKGGLSTMMKSPSRYLSPLLSEEAGII